MKVTLFMAMSLNGMISSKISGEDFLSDLNWKTFVELGKKIGCVIIGRKTLEAVRGYEDYNFDNIEAKKIVVTSGKIKENYIVAGSPKDALLKAEKNGFKHVLLTGGGILNTSFIKDDLIDEMILNVEPELIGRGISLFSEEDFEKRLEFIGIKKLKEGILQLQYKVKK